MPSGRRYWSRLVPHRYLVYKLLHLLHGVVSLQQRRHSHEAFVAAPVVLFLLLLVILFVYSSVIWDVLRRREKQTLLTTTGSRGPILHSGAFARYAARDGRRRERWGFLAFGFVRTSWKAQQLHDGGSLLKQAQNEWKLITSPAGSSSSNCTSVVENKTKQNKQKKKIILHHIHASFFLRSKKSGSTN